MLDNISMAMMAGVNSNATNGMFNGILGKIKSGCCRLAPNGRIAVKTDDGYKTYNPKTGNVTNCSNFVLDVADDWFMVIPTRSLRKGDIVLINGKPVYVLEVKSANRVEVMNYEDSTIQTVIPERHAIMGRRFYGKIVSLIGNGFGGKGKNDFFKNMLKLKMMGTMFGGNSSSREGFGGNGLAMMMLMGGGAMDGMFDGMLDADESDEDADDTDEETFDIFGDEEDEAKPLKKAAKKTTKKTTK